MLQNIFLFNFDLVLINLKFIFIFIIKQSVFFSVLKSCFPAYTLHSSAHTQFCRLATIPSGSVWTDPILISLARLALSLANQLSPY